MEWWRGWKERSLEKAGDINALQKYRQKIMSRTRDDYAPVTLLIQANYGLRSTVQQEIMLNEELAEIQGNSNPRNTEIKEQLQKLNKEYWLFSQKLWLAQSAFKTGPLKRAISLWHSHPRWYMHKFLVQNCAGKGGCCGRDCGCCVNRPIAQSRELGVGHCTTGCGCCAKYRGFHLTEEEKRDHTKRFDILTTSRFPNYGRSVVQVLLFGTLEAENTNPFDMIYEPTRREYMPLKCTRDKCALVTSQTRTPCNSLGDTRTGLEKYSDTELCTGEVIDLSNGGGI